MNIVVRAFQSLSEVAIEALGLTVLVGPSHRGKSAMIRAIQGALFNRPGTDFVRKGSKAARVVLTDVPVVQGLPLEIEWEKGSKTNSYRVNGRDYTRVGLGTPQPLLSAGYKDVFIGDAEKKKGESLRPQVGSQFEPLFLLTRSPAFVADVLSVVQRRAVLTRAQDRCATDVRQQKELHKVRQADLAAAAQQEQAFEGLDALLARFKPTIALARDIEERQARAQEMQGLLQRRAVLAAVQAELTRAFAALDAVVAAQHQTLHSAQIYEQRAAAWARYRATRMVPTALPPQTALGDLPARVERWQGLTQIVARRAALWPLRGVSLQAPGVVGQLIPSLEHFVTTADKVEHQIQVRAQSVRSVHRLTSEHRALGDEVTDLAAHLRQVQAEAKVCPVCERPWS